MDYILKMLKTSNFIAIFIALISFSCDSSNERYSDLKLTSDDNFGEVYVTSKNRDEIIFNVEEIEPFNYAHIMFDDRFFIINHKRTDSLLVLNRKTLIPKDTIDLPFEYFNNGQGFKVILGKKRSSNPDDLDIDAVYGINVVVIKSSKNTSL